MKGMKDIKCSVNLWVFQVLLAGIVACPLTNILILLALISTLHSWSEYRPAANCSQSRHHALQMNRSLGCKNALRWNMIGINQLIFVKAINDYIAKEQSIFVILLKH